MPICFCINGLDCVVLKQRDCRPNAAYVTVCARNEFFVSYFRVHCSPMTWIRPSFKIYSPHWGLCISVEDGSSPLIDTPLDRSPFSPPPSAALARTCGDANSRRDVWVWHWSFHLKNRFTETCLTATAMPTFLVSFFKRSFFVIILIGRL